MAKEACPYESWSAMNDEAILAEKERKRMSMSWRSWEISVARANNWGHAAFRPGELAKLCCGVDTEANRSAVHRGMKTLAEMERIAPVGKHGSTQHCILVNRNYVWRGAGKGSRKDVCSKISHLDTREIPWSPTVMEPRFVAPPVAESRPAEYDDPWADDDAQAATEVAPNGESKQKRSSWRRELFNDVY